MPWSRTQSPLQTPKRSSHSSLIDRISPRGPSTETYRARTSSGSLLARLSSPTPVGQEADGGSLTVTSARTVLDEESAIFRSEGITTSRECFEDGSSRLSPNEHIPSVPPVEELITDLTESSMDVAMADAIREPASLTSSPYVSPPSRNGFKPDSQAKAPGGSNSDAVRHALRPILVTMLERRREFGTDTSTGPINVDAILANMTDEYCTAFIAQAKLVMTQMKELNIKRGELATSSVVANGTGEPHQVPGEPPTSITSNTPEAAESRPGGHSGRDSVSMRQAEDFLQSMKDVVSPAVLSEELSRGAHPPAPERSENYTPPANTLPDGSHQKNEAAEQHPNTLAIPEPKTAALSGNVEQHPNDGHEGTQIAVASDEMTSDVAMYLPPIPGLWLVKFGLETPGILDAPFDVPDEVADAAHRWAKRRTSFDYTLEHVSVHILCLPNSAVTAFYEALPEDASPAFIADGLFAIQNDWPDRGSLFMQLNGDKPYRQIWTPATLPSIPSPVDISALVHSGTNSLRLVSLSDLSKYVFIVHASFGTHEMFLAESAPSRVVKVGPTQWPRQGHQTSS